MKSQDKIEKFIQEQKVKVCPECGMSQKDWKSNQGQGYRQGGETYCCRGCADFTGCECRTALEEIDSE